MYKRQMKFEKIACFAVLVACAVVFIYSLGLMTDLYDCFYKTMSNPDNLHETDVEGSYIYYEMQGFNSDLTKYGIGLIVVSLLLFVSGTHSRRKYYIANYIAAALTAGANIAVTVWALPKIMAYKAEFLLVDFEALKEFAEMWKSYYTESTFWFDAAWFVFGLLMLATLALIVNMILKVILMKNEKRLLKDGKGVTVS